MTTSPSTPLVSIITPVFNNWRFLEQLRASLLRNTPREMIEIIFVDNGSTEPQMDHLYSSLDALGERVVRNGKNLGFGRANNIGFAQSRGDFLCLLNSDMLVTPGWLEPLLTTMLNNPTCGAVQSKILLVDDGPLGTWKTQTCGAAFDNRGLPAYFLSGFGSDAPEVNKPLRLQAFMGTGVLLRKLAVDTVGGFDEEYDLVFMEDTDLSLRMSEAGFTTLYEPRSLLYHFHSTSMPHLSQEEYDRSRVNNVRRFTEKWPPKRIGKIMENLGF